MSTDTAPPAFRFTHRLRVRWVEVDMQQIVFNGHYLMYFDTAVSDYWRALRLPYHDAMQLLQGDLYVKKATVEYHASAHYDELLEVGMRCARIGNSSIQFQCGIERGGELLIGGELLYVFADPATQTSKPVPPALRELMLGYEAGEPTAQLRVGTWGDHPELQAGCRDLRSQVFLDEQQIPKELEWDEADHTAVHALITNRLGQAVATARLLQPSPSVAQIGRMAVHRALRGGSLGREALEALVAVAKQRGDREVMLHAQKSAIGFYKRLGFEGRGAPFMEAGIEHLEMVRRL